MDHQLVGERDHVGPPHARNCRHLADAMEPATERDHAAVRGTATFRELCDERSLTSKVATKPRLALGEERDGVSLTVAAAGPRRHRHHHAAFRVQDDPKATGSRRVT